MKVVLFCGGLGCGGARTATAPLPSRWPWSASGRCSGMSCATTLTTAHRLRAVSRLWLPRRSRTSSSPTTNAVQQLRHRRRPRRSCSAPTSPTGGSPSSIRPALRRAAAPGPSRAKMFMANYADVLTTASLPDMVKRFRASDAVASLLAVPPQSSHHVVDIARSITQVTPRCRTCGSGKTAAASCSARRSCDSSTRARSTSGRADGPAGPAAPGACLPVRDTGRPPT